MIASAADFAASKFAVSPGKAIASSCSAIAGIVGDDQARGRAAEALVGAHRHQMRTLRQRVRPGAAGDHAAEMRGIEQQQRADLVGDPAQFAHRVREQVEAAADGDQLRAQRQRLLAQRGDIDAVAVGVDRGDMDVQPVEAGAARRVVGDVAADGRRRHDDRGRPASPPS